MDMTTPSAVGVPPEGPKKKQIPYLPLVSGIVRCWERDPLRQEGSEEAAAPLCTMDGRFSLPNRCTGRTSRATSWGGNSAVEFFVGDVLLAKIA